SSAIYERLFARLAAFRPLGLSTSNGRTVALAATSGSAIGQMLPAVMEANHTATPLLVLSADRPDELHGTGASQSTRQKSLFGEHVRLAANVAAGVDPGDQVQQALAALAGDQHSAAGPVQLNLQFRDPLVPAPQERIIGQA